MYYRKLETSCLAYSYKNNAEYHYNFCTSRREFLALPVITCGDDGVLARNDILSAYPKIGRIAHAGSPDASR
jgi:hypothetical protein